MIGYEVEAVEEEEEKEEEKEQKEHGILWKERSKRDEKYLTHEKYRLRKKL